MPTSKRAWLYVVRSRKRTALLFLLLTALMTASLLGFALYTASVDAVKELRGSIGGYLTIHTGTGGGWTDEALLGQLQTLEGVRAYNGVDTYYLYAEGLALVPACWHGTGSVNEFTPKLIGCTDTALQERFLSSDFQLADGRQITPGDTHKAMVSEDVAALNGLSVGDRLILGAVPGVRDWPAGAADTQIEYEIVGIYAVTRSEPLTPTMAEYDLQENIIFTDINSAKQLQQIRFPYLGAGEFRYSSGIMLFPEDPAKLTEMAERLKQQVDADWDSLLIFENSAAYRQAAPSIQKAGTFSLLLLAAILVVSIGVLSLTLLLWTRERMTEIGILISLGIPAKGICGQLLLENYFVAAPAYLTALLLGTVLSGPLCGAAQALQKVQLGLTHAVAVLLCAAAVVLITVLLAAVPVLRKKPKEILTDFS